MTDAESSPAKLDTEPARLRRSLPGARGREAARGRPRRVSCVGLFVTVTTPSQDGHVHLRGLGAFLSLTGLAQRTRLLSALGGEGEGGWGGDSPLGLMRGLQATVRFLSAFAAPTPVCKTEQNAAFVPQDAGSSSSPVPNATRESRTNPGLAIPPSGT